MVFPIEILSSTGAISQCIAKCREKNAVVSTKPYCVCVDGILCRDGKILLLKRNVEPFKGYWHIVGGHVEERETLKEALKREYKEETNLDVEVGDIIDWRVEETSDRIKLIVVFRIKRAEGKVKINEESVEYRWFSTLPVNSVSDYKFLLEKIF